MAGEVLYQPSRWGEVYHSLPYDEVLGAGSAGPGKSIVLLHEADQQIMTEHQRCAKRSEAKYPLRWGESAGWCLHLRRTSTRLEQSIVRSHRVFPAMDPGARWDASKKTWIFSSGYRYQFGHCHDVDDWTQYLSFEFSLILYDELVEFDEEQYDQINTRLRSSDPVLSKMLKIRSMSNPVMTQADGVVTKNPYWVRDRFVKPAPQGKVAHRRALKTRTGEFKRWYTWFYWPATLYDNPDPLFVQQYEERLLAAKPHIRQALLYGDWFVTASSFYAGVWNPQLHVVEPFTIPDNWGVFRSMDWGFKAPGCIHWWAVDQDGNLWCIYELTFQEKNVSEVVQMVERIERKLKLWKNGSSQITGPADTQLWEQRGDIVQSKAEEFAFQGVPWTKADKHRARLRNAELLYERLKDHGKGTGVPGIVFFRNCPQIIATIPSIPTDPKDINSPMDGGEDHWHDSALYACAYASRSDGITRESMDDDDDEYEQRRTSNSRGRHGYGGW
jgi:hypothetical protein